MCLKILNTSNEKILYNLSYGYTYMFVYFIVVFLPMKIEKAWLMDDVDH